MSDYEATAKSNTQVIIGRGSSIKPDARYLNHTRHQIDDGWEYVIHGYQSIYNPRLA